MKKRTSGPYHQVLAIHAVSQVIEQILKVREGWCAMVTIDVKSAFNSLLELIIEKRLRDEIGEGPILTVA